MTKVQFEVRGPVAVVTIDNPPVNALGAAVREGLAKAIEAANADASVTAIVIASAGKAFIAGADISEFGKPPAAPLLPDLLDAIEAFGQARRGGDPGRGARRRTRGRARLPWPCRAARSETRPARGQARPHSRRGRHAAPAAPDRRGEGLPDDAVGRARLGRRRRSTTACSTRSSPAISSRQRSALAEGLAAEGRRPVTSADARDG